MGLVVTAEKDYGNACVASTTKTTMKITTKIGGGGSSGQLVQHILQELDLAVTAMIARVLDDVLVLGYAFPRLCEPRGSGLLAV